MPDAPATDLRQEARDQLILDDELIEFLGERFGFDERDITAVQTYCFWLRCDLPTKDLSLEDLVTVLDNRRLLAWVRRNHRDANIGRFEKLCHEFVMQSSLVIDQLANLNPEVQP